MDVGDAAIANPLPSDDPVSATLSALGLPASDGPGDGLAVEHVIAAEVAAPEDHAASSRYQSSPRLTTRPFWSSA